MLQKDLEARRKYHANKKKKKKEQSLRSRKRSIKRNKKYVEIHKLANPCSCGEIEPYCLSYHHNNGDKKANISDMVNRGYGITRIQKEIDKCIILCLNCHARLHHKEKLKKESKI